MASLSSSDRQPSARREKSRRRRAPAVAPKVAAPVLPRLAGLARGLFVVTLLIAVIPLGSVGWASLNVATVATAGTAILAMLITGENPSSRWVSRAALVLVTGLAAYIWGQGIVMPDHPYAHPVWRIAGSVTGSHLGAISVDPAQSRFALSALVMPFLVFLSGLSLFRTDGQASALLRTLGIIVGLIAVFGIVQFMLFPDSLLIYDKPAYRDSLTGVFVNRNTAATLFGVGSLLVFVSLQEKAGERWMEVWGALTTRPLRFLASEQGLAWYGALFLATLIALVLTRSRAGVAATLVAYLVLIPLLVVGGRGRRSAEGRQAGARSGARRAGSALIGIVAVLAVALLFAGQAIYRADVQGLEDDRFCIMPGLFRAIGDNWRWGSGYATFGDVFPPYRDPACGTYGLWDKAHDFYLEGMITLGLAFVVAVVVVYTGLIWTWVRGLRTRRRHRVAAATGLAITVLVTLHDMIDFSLQIPGLAVVVAAALAGCVTLALGRRPLKAPGEDVYDGLKRVSGPLPDPSPAG